MKSNKKTSNGHLWIISIISRTCSYTRAFISKYSFTKHHTLKLENSLKQYFFDMILSINIEYMFLKGHTQMDQQSSLMPLIQMTFSHSYPGLTKGGATMLTQNPLVLKTLLESICMELMMELNQDPWPKMTLEMWQEALGQVRAKGRCGQGGCTSHIWLAQQKTCSA